MTRVRVSLVAGLVAASLVAAENGYPAFSPDGQWLVFSSDAAGNQDLYLANRNGEEVVRLTMSTASETQPTWSPDGESVAYIRQPWNPTGESALFIVDCKTKDNRRVGELSGVHLPSWAGDGRIYLSMRVNGQSDIFSVRSDGSDLVNHTNTPNVSEANVDVRDNLMVYDLPDGDDYAIEILDLETGAKRVLKKGGLYWDPVWSANGKRLLIGVYAEPEATMSRMTEFDLSGQIIKQWTPDNMNAFWPAVSPDGKTVVFSYSDQDFGVGELYRLDFENGKISRFLKP